MPGIPIHGPAKPEVQSIEVGINRVFAAFALNQILVFDDLHGFLDELQSYSRELDEWGSRRVGDDQGGVAGRVRAEWFSAGVL